MTASNDITVTKSNGTTCAVCGKALLTDDATAYLTQVSPHYFFYICDACEKAKTVKAEA
jgi:hypothetical protein